MLTGRWAGTAGSLQTPRRASIPVSPVTQSQGNGPKELRSRSFPSQDPRWVGAQPTPWFQPCETRSKSIQAPQCAGLLTHRGRKITHLCCFMPHVSVLIFTETKFLVIRSNRKQIHLPIISRTFHNRDWGTKNLPEITKSVSVCTWIWASVSSSSRCLFTHCAVLSSCHLPALCLPLPARRHARVHRTPSSGTAG